MEGREGAGRLSRDEGGGQTNLVFSQLPHIVIPISFLPPSLLPSLPPSSSPPVQMVWADTYEVGCGSFRCSELRMFEDGDYGAMLLVCNYGPGYVGVQCM